MSTRRPKSGEARRAIAALLLALAGTAHAAPAVRIDTVEPRPFGYTIGDVLEREVRIEVDRRYALERARLPRARRIDAWLEARPSTVVESRQPGTRHYTITLAYQVVGSPEAVRTLVLPEVQLVFTGGGVALAQTLPEWPITVAPLTPLHVLGRAGLEELRPDRVPAALATRPFTLRLSGYAVTAALLLLYLAWRRFGMPWPGRAGPFARAYRDLARMRAPARDTQALHAALRRVHRAFDETARRTVFAAELGAFFAAHPRFAPLQPETERFFVASRREFYGEGRSAGGVEEMRVLCREYRRRERGGR